VELTVLSQALAVIAGLVVALLRFSANPVAAWPARFYVWFFRAVPLLVQLLFWYNVALLLPALRLDVPVIGFDVPVNDVVSGFTAAVLGLGLHEAAFMAEIIRAGVQSVPQPQIEAAMDLGASRGQAIRRVVLPQALRVIIPPAGNQFVGILKASALVSAIGGGDLLTRVQFLIGQNFLVIPLLTVATIWYLVLVTVFSALQHLLEARLRGRASGPGQG
jgi:polar amino acid transport system permease protein